ncbi:MAG: serine hydrolase domain-containing protein [Gemmatimonadota bacterium]
MKPRHLSLLLAGTLACARSPSPAPIPRCDAGRCDWSGLTSLVDSAVAAEAAPGVVVGISVRGGRFIYGTGRTGLEDPTVPGPRTVYDLASLTKVVALTTGIMLAVDEGRLALDTPARLWVPEFAGAGKDQVTLRHLLTHTSGLPPFRRLWLETATAAEARDTILATPLDTVPGIRTSYSDLGAILLTWALERSYGTSIDTLLEQRVFGPLGMHSTRYQPPATWSRGIAPTEDDPWRGHILRGEVHDENAAWLGGVSGHAGLFSTAEDLLTFGEWLLSGLTPSRTNGADHRWPVPAPNALPSFVVPQHLVAGSSRALGWDTPSEGSSAGTRLGPQSFGHTGYTGTSIWIDPDRALVVVLLTNRVHPTRDNPRLTPLRPAVADRVAEIVDRPAR